MVMKAKATLGFASVTFLGALCTVACADDTLKLSIGQMEVWAQQPAILGQQAGIFKKYGLNLDYVGTQGAAETLEAVISGATDIGIGIGTVGVMRAFVRGAPVRIFAGSFTGAGDVYWYVKADSPIKSLQDATDRNTIAYSTNGATSHSAVLGFVSELGCKAIPTATGGLPATLTQVMSGQIDIGWAGPPFGLKQIQDGQIRLIATGNDVVSMRSQTVRVQVVNTRLLAERKGVFLRFVRAYREALAWVFDDPRAMQMYAQAHDVPLGLVKRTADEFQTRPGMQFDAVSGVDDIMADGVKMKFLEAPLTNDQLKELIQIPPPGS
jgi:NitT/TauT family transport system substrate-binding protein